MNKLHFCLLFHLSLVTVQTLAQNLAIESKSYFLGKTEIKAVKHSKSGNSEVVFINLHDDENTSVEAALAHLARFGGQLIELQHSGKRLVEFDLEGQKFKIDPNRIFTRAGIRKNLERYGNYTEKAEKLIFDWGQQLIKDFLQGYKMIIAMHNNGNSKGFSVKSFAKGGNFADEAEKTYINPQIGRGDFFYVIDKQHFDFLQTQQWSVVLQNNASVTDDGSLSVFCSQNSLAYINVEAEHGHLQPQIKMLEVLAKLSSR
jgi:hypothetical protein